MAPTPGTEAWFAQVTEEIVEPERSIVDPHHHLWPASHWTRGAPYLLEHLWADTGSGHDVQKTVFVQCRTGYREHGPDRLKPVGETEFVAGVAARTAAGPGRAVIAGIVGFADLTQGGTLGEVLDAHEEAGDGLFRGIRHAGAHHPYPDEAHYPGRFPPDLFAREAFRAGVRTLGRRGLTYESWHYHTQLRDFLDLARSAPNTTVILDHVGGPLGHGASFRGRRDEVYESWQRDIAALAESPNVYAKLGGLAMPDSGFGWHEAARPPSSDDLVAAHARYYLHTIDCFGVNRCMFESNFPVDKLSVSYPVLWNAFKKIVADFSDDEKQALFYGTAANVYRL